MVDTPSTGWLVPFREIRFEPFDGMPPFGGNGLTDGVLIPEESNLIDRFRNGESNHGLKDFGAWVGSMSCSEVMKTSE